MIYILNGRDTAQYPELMEQVHSLRHRVFVEELKWSDLSNPTGLEYDQFDTDDAVHHIAMRDGVVVGYQRMLPTDKPHLLSDVFPQLCMVDFPRGPDIFELTRYCVDPAYRQRRREIGSVGSELMVGFVEWGLALGVKQVIIEFETVWVLRALQLKFLAQPLGLETQIGNQKITATLATFSEETLEAIRRYRGISEPVINFLGSDTNSFREIRQ